MATPAVLSNQKKKWSGLVLISDAPLEIYVLCMYRVLDLLGCCSYKDPSTNQSLVYPLFCPLSVVW